MARGGLPLAAIYPIHIAKLPRSVGGLGKL